MEGTCNQALQCGTQKGNGQDKEGTSQYFQAGGGGFWKKEEVRIKVSKTSLSQYAKGGKLKLSPMQKEAGLLLKKQMSSSNMPYKLQTIAM